MDVYLLVWLTLGAMIIAWGALLFRRYRGLHDDSERDHLSMAAELHQRRIDETVALQRKDELFQIIENLPVGLGLWRGEHFVYINRSWVDWLGYESAEEIYPLKLIEMSHPDDRNKGTTDMARLGPIRPSGYRIFRKDGGLETFEISTVGQVTFEGSPTTLVSALWTTEKRKLEEQLIHGARMASVGTLAAGVAHEINNPLAGMVANVQYVEEAMRAEGADADWLEALEQSLEGARRVERIVRDLALFSGAGSSAEGQISDVRRVVETACTMMNREIAPLARLEVSMESVPFVRGDGARLAQCFVSLLQNAVQAIPEGSGKEERIGIQVSRLPGGEVAVEISDSGAGIPRDRLERIFDPFWTTRPVGAGTGMGLPICHGIVSSCGGRIEVESAMGQGSTFRVVLQPATDLLDAPDLSVA